MLEMLAILPVVALLATIVCIPLLADEMPGTPDRADGAQRKANRQIKRSATVPYVSMRSPHRDQ